MNNDNKKSIMERHFSNIYMVTKIITASKRLY